jgi:hypothetical protein
MDIIVCTNCSYQHQYQSASYDYRLADGTRLYVLICRAWCSSCSNVVEAEYLRPIEEIDKELRTLDELSREDASTKETEVSARIRNFWLQRRAHVLTRHSPARCLGCGSTAITPWTPRKPLLHPGCGGELRLLSSAPSDMEVPILCDDEGNRIQSD